MNNFNIHISCTGLRYDQTIGLFKLKFYLNVAYKLQVLNFIEKYNILIIDRN
jgi:hypothetical protein